MSRLTLIIGSKNLSSWSLRPWLALRHLSIDFDEIELPLDTPEYHRRIDQYSPTRRVPVLIDGATKIWDSLAICEYANELADGKGWPRDSQARAVARSISAEMHSGFQALRNTWPMKATSIDLKVELSDEGKRDVARIDALWTECRKRYAASGSWLFGEFSIADAMFAPVALRFRTYGAILSSTAQQYLTTTLSDRHLQAWITASVP